MHLTIETELRPLKSLLLETLLLAIMMSTGSPPQIEMSG